MTFVKNILLVIFYSLSGFAALAGGIKGTIRAEDGSPLVYATIFVKQTGTGSATDINGYYEIVLAPGHYDVLYQYLGFESITKSIDVTVNFRRSTSH
jgi:hypothetical protein